MLIRQAVWPTLVSIAGSQAITLSACTILDLDNVGAMMAVAFVCPAILAPPISFYFTAKKRELTATNDALVAAYAALEHQSRHDGLTGLLNRGAFLALIRIAVSEPPGGALLIVDADHFKLINDTYGHSVGDEALKSLADVLRTTSPADAAVGRLGGEEFGVFLPGANETEAARVAHDLCLATRRSGQTVAGHDIRMTISLGGVMTQPGDSLEQTMSLADAALYQAKRSGRDRHYIALATETMPALMLKSIA
jgi:diguanylate cyclase